MSICIVVNIYTMLSSTCVLSTVLGLLCSVATNIMYLVELLLWLYYIDIVFCHIYCNSSQSSMTIDNMTDDLHKNTTHVSNQYLIRYMVACDSLEFNWIWCTGRLILKHWHFCEQFVIIHTRLCTRQKLLRRKKKYVTLYCPQNAEQTIFSCEKEMRHVRTMNNDLPEAV